MFSAFEKKDFSEDAFGAGFSGFRVDNRLSA
jgi:hypothetical protein